MAAHTIKREDVFPVGTSVSAYPLSNWPQSQRPPSGAPVGSPAATGTVQADGTVAFSGLAADTDYVAYAASPDRYVRFHTPKDSGATKRVTLPVGSDGVNTNTAASKEYNGRALVLLPVTTSRWRMRVRNCSALSGTANAGAWDISGVWVGDPLYTSTDPQWGRVFASAPSQALAAWTTPADGSEYVSSWVTDPNLQFQANKPRGVSYGMAQAASGTFVYSTQGWTWGGAGAAAAAGNATPGGTGLNNFVVLDWRIEYEFVGSAPIGVFIGDSITAGWTSDTSTPASKIVSGWDPHQSWPGAAGIRNGYAWHNMGVGSTTGAQWSSGTGWRWDRVDFATTVPDFAVISLGTNDAAAGTAAATVQGYIAAMVAAMRARGINEVYLGTITPRNYATPANDANQTIQDALNAWMRNMPAGIAGVFDFEKAVQLQASPRLMDSAYVGTIGYPHPNRAGYQRMAAEVIRTRVG